MKESKIKVYVAEPGTDDLQECLIDNTLEAMQNIVGGYLETVTLDKDVVLICNEEGRLMNLQPSVCIHGITYVGTVILAGYDSDGEFRSLPADLFS